MKGAELSHDPDRSTGSYDVFALFYGAANEGGEMKAVRLSFAADGTRTASSTIELDDTSNIHANDRESVSGDWGVTYDKNLNKHIVIVSDTQGGTKVVEVTVGGDGNASGTISAGEFSSKLSTLANEYSYSKVIYDESVSKTIISYSDSGYNSDTQSGALLFRMITGPAVASTKTNFDGFAQYAASDGNLVAAKLDYSIDNNQSGLTAGSTYYLDSETALTTTSTSNQKVGVALTDTDLQIVKT